MHPDIRRYLDEHGATYTSEALRKGLLDAKYDPVLVDAALREWQADRAGAHPNREERRRFGRWAFGLHLGALVAMFVLVVLLKGTTAMGIALLAALVLAVALMIGWAISSLIGRAFLRRGLTIALVVPAISAVALGGSCFALMNASVQPPPLGGSADLQILEPRPFEGSGAAACYLSAGNVVFGIDATDLGMLDDKTVSVSLSWSGDGGAGGIPSESLSIYLNSTSGAQSPESYSTIFSTRLDVNAAANRRSGAIRFEGLAAEPVGAPGAPSQAPISGSFNWTCA
jgi:hypothetical protein